MVTQAAHHHLCTLRLTIVQDSPVQQAPRDRTMPGLAMGSSVSGLIAGKPGAAAG
jgi:hypothetical protein